VSGVLGRWWVARHARQVVGHQVRAGGQWVVERFRRQAVDRSRRMKAVIGKT
jgi:hypothetical protein